MINTNDRNHKNTDVSILAAPFGFGPLGKALAIAHEFRRRGLSVKILGDKISTRIIEANGILAETYVYRKRLDLKNLRTKLVISCLDVSTPIIKSDIPLVLVDSLFWLRGLWERPLSTKADLVLAQKFFIEPSNEVAASLGDRLKTVDAILPISSVSPITIDDRRSVVFYPGGLRSPYLDFNYQEKYFTWGVRVVIEALIESEGNLKDLIVIVPPQLVETDSVNQIRLLGGQVEISSSDLGVFLASARCLIVAPGIEIMLEACATGNIPYYLPAFNGSHIPQLMGYRLAGIGAEISPSHRKKIHDLEIHTNNLSKLSRDIEKRNVDILSEIKYKKEAVINLVEFLRRNNLINVRYPLGKSGTKQVVDYSLELLSKKQELNTFIVDESHLRSTVLTGRIR